MGEKKSNLLWHQKGQGKETGGVTICAMPVMTMARWIKNPVLLGPKPSVLRV